MEMEERSVENSTGTSAYRTTEGSLRYDFKDILIDTSDTLCRTQNIIFRNAASLLLNC